MNKHFRHVLVHDLDENIRAPVPTKPHIGKPEKVYKTKFVEDNGVLEHFVEELNTAISDGYTHIDFEYNSAIVSKLETEIEFQARLAQDKLKMLEYEKEIAKARVELEQMYQFIHGRKSDEL